MKKEILWRGDFLFSPMKTKRKMGMRKGKWIVGSANEENNRG